MAEPKEYIPKWIAWESTQRCNLSCVHCRCSSELTSSAGDFNTQEAFKLIDDICEVSTPVMVLSGGEPLMREDIFEIARYGTSKGLRMCMATNGTLITDAVCAEMKSADIKMVSLSLDGSTAEIHDNFRSSPGAYAGVMRGAETLKRNGIPFLVNSSFTKRNQQDIAATFRVAKELGATAWYMFMIVPTGRGEEIMSELISPEDYEEILTWHYEQEKNEEDILMRPTCAPHYYRIVAQSICLIDCFGNLKPCSYFHSSVGNVKQIPFKELWFNSKVFNDLRDNSKYTGKCGECEYVNVCGGCRARADAVHGDYMAEEPFCNYIPPKTRKRLAEEAENATK